MPERKKIIHIIQSLDNGGCENMLLRTLPLLQSFDHAIVTLKEPGELAPQFVSAGITVRSVHYHGLFDISGIVRLRSLIREMRPDVILTYLFHADAIGRLGLAGTTDTHIIPFLRTTYNHPKYLLARVFEWLTKPLVKQYLTNSEAVKDFYINHIGVHSERISVIPNGIDTDYFDSLIPDPDLKESLSIKANNFVIICVANLHINKGHRYLLEAFETVYQEHPETRLLIVGDGIEYNNLKNQIKEFQSKDNIIFLGRRTDVPKLLKISDCFVLPTLFEGQSNAIMEAMASGLPVITTDIPENRALIDDRHSGILVSSKSTDELVHALQLVLSSKTYRESLGTTGKSFLEKKFTLIKTAADLSFYLSKL